MAKTRLNEDKRHTLSCLAQRVVQATPIDVKMERRVLAAQKAYDKGHAALIVEAKRIIDRDVTPAELKVLRKFSATTRLSRKLFTDVDTREPVYIEFFNKLRWERENASPDSRGFEVQQAWHCRREAAKAATEVELPDKFRPVVSARLAVLEKAHTTNETELEIAEGADQEKRRTIMRDFTALISGSRTFEDVVEVWPEAKQVTDKVCAVGTALSLISDEAKDRIKANMASRGVE